MPPAHVQSANVDNVFATTCDVSLTGTAAGNLLVCSVALNEATDVITSVNGSASGAFTRADWFGGSSVGLHIYYKANCAGGNETVTVTVSSSKSINAALHEYSGVQTSSPLDVTDVASGTGSTSTDADVSPAVVTTTDGQLIFSSIVQTSGTLMSFTAGTNYTREQHGSYGSGAARHGTEDRVQSAAGSVQGLWTGSTTDNYICGIATFKAASGATSVTPTVGVGTLAGTQSILGAGILTRSMIQGT